MKNVLKSAALLLAVSLFSFLNNTAKAQCPIDITSVSATSVSCFGVCDGTITVSISGGTAPYSYIAINVPFIVTYTTANPAETTHTFTGLCGGDYTVVVQSAGNLCSDAVQITVPQPPQLNVAMSFTPVTCNGGSDGTATATASGGAGGYTYLWVGGATTATRTGLTAGTYNVTVTDANSCTVNGSVTVTQPPGMSPGSVVTPVACNGQSNGAIDLTITGGTGPYTYLWSPGGATTEDISGLAAGSYSVVVTDANLCTLNVPPIAVTQPLVLSSSETHVNVNCAGSNTGSIDLTVAGGTTPYTYLWNTGQTTQDLSGLAPGLYSVTVTDSRGCTTTSSATITQLSNLSVSSLITDAACGASNGAVDVSVTGGSGNYTYLWSPGNFTTQDISGLSANVYTVTVTDVTFGCTQVLGNNVQNTGNPDITGIVTNASNCNATNGAIDITVTGGSGSYSYLWTPGNQTTQDRTNLAVGSYTVRVTDNTSGCIAISTFSVANNNPISLSAVTTPSSCSSNSGAVDLTVTGGTGPFTYAWSNGAITQDLTAVGPGVYSVTVTDANGCTSSSAFPVTGSNGVNVTSVQTNVTCFGHGNGSIDLTVSGGTGPFTYTWSNGATTQDVSSLSPGTYTVQVRDASSGCFSFLTFTITQPTAFSGFVDITPVTCNGGSNGAIDLTIGGATPGYTYLWLPGNQTTQDLSGLSAGSYSVTIRDANNCTIGGTLTVTQPTAIVLSETHVNASCAGGTNGSINLSVSGGTSPYTYGWSNGATTQDLSGLSAGFYSVTVTDANGCTANLNVSVTELSNLTINIVSVVNSQCNDNTGSIDITVSGGSGNYTYSWSPAGETTQDRTALAPGIYTVTVTDITLGCVQSQAINVSETGAPTVTGVITQATTCVATNGAIDVSVSGGSGNYSYLWTPGGQVTQDRTNLAPGVYTVEVTDVNTGCSGLTSFTVTSGNTMTLSGTVTNSTCSSSVGAIDLTVSGGTPGYTYLWTNGAITQDISGLPGAIYGVTVTDANGCTSNSFFTVSETSGMNLTVAITNITCAGGVNGAINLTVTGGSGNYTYLWSNGASTQDLSSIPAGSYSVNVTDATTGCTTFAIYTVTEPTPITLSTTITNIPCSGSGTGSIDLTVSGGTPGYTYSWSPGGQTTQDISGLAVGNYILVFSDANGCGGTYTFAITQPTPIVITETHVNVTCNGSNNGSIDISVSGGTAGYTYLWAPAGQTTQDRTGLAPNTYTVTVTDANGCTASLPVTITQPAVLTATETHTNVTCFGANNGTIDVTVSGGTGTYTYVWTPPGPTTQDRTGLAPGTYSVVITDQNGCTTSINNIVITQPASGLTANITNSVNVTCFGLCNGSATVGANGGTPGYTYSWNTVPVQTTQTAVNLCSGIYTVTVTDANGCTAQSSVTIIQPNDLIASASQTPVSCQGVCDGTLTGSQTGGTPSYTYLWLPGNQTTISITNQCAGTYQLIVTDLNGCDDTATVVITQPLTITANASSTPATCNGICNGTATVTPSGGTSPYTYLWSPGNQTTQTITNLCAGIYTCTITDANGCSTVATVTVTNATAIVINISSTDPVCNGSCNGTITATPSGGTAPYTYLWSPGGQTGNALTNLCAGTYTVIVTDANGCQQSATVTLSQPTPIVVTPTFSQPSCNGGCNGSASVSVTGGVPGYTYLWSPGGETTSSITGICAGTVVVTITDANGCTQVVNISVPQPTALLLGRVVTNSSCNGADNGSINLTVSGGTPGYTYLWDNGQTTQDISNLAPGTYNVTVTDANGCTATTSGTITEPTPITISTVSTPATCGLCDGSATITPSGGTGTYTYLWGTGATTATATNLCAGVYPVFVTDANGCVGSFAIPISNLGGPSSATVNTTGVSCFGVCDGSASVTPVGGAAPYTYLWVPGGQTTSSVTGLCGGTYNVQISDTNNCVLTQSVVITEPAQLQANETVVTPGCGLCNGSITLTPSGGQAPYTYLWSPGGQTTGTISGLCAGVYTVVITDANGCTQSVAIPVNNIPASSIVLSGTAASCNGACDGTATVTVTLGTAPFTYLWSNGQTTATATGLCAGTYSVQVRDVNNCIATDIITISEPAPLALSLLVVQNSSCSGSCNGSIDVIPSGGTLPYSYSWSPSVSTTANASNLCAGTYTITVSDANGCTTVITGTVTDPTGLTATVAGTDIDCNGVCNGTATVTPAGGTPGYTIAWNTVPVQTTATATGLCAGTYTATVTDANGCIILATITLTQPTAVTTSFVNVINLSCSGVCDGQATVVASGGVPPYTYLWNDVLGTTNDTATGLCAQTYTVQVTDANNCTTPATITLNAPNGLTLTTTQQNVTCNGLCNGSATVTVSGGVSPYTYQWSDQYGQTTTTASSLCPGVYTLTVTDANSCVATAIVTITEPAVLSASPSSTPATCGQCNGTGTVSASGGTAPYAYTWSNGATTASATNLCAGVYAVTVTDANGCQQMFSIPVSNSSGPATATVTTTDASCAGACDGTASVTATGVAGPFTYLWVPGGQTTTSVSALCAGTYFVQVSDTNNCILTQSFTISEPAQIVANEAITNTACGACNGDITLTPSGGTGPYTYLWGGGQTTPGISGLCAGIYTVTITDANNCTETRSFAVSNPQNSVISTSSAGASCNGACDGTATVSVTSGTGPFTYLWSDGQTTTTATNLCAGTYTVNVTDANGCVATKQVTVTEPAPLALSQPVVFNVSCNSLCDGVINIIASGGTMPYTYSWSNGQTDEPATSLCAGTYNVTVTDARGCSVTITGIIVTEPTPLNITTSVTDAQCFGACDGTATATVTGGVSPYTYLWTNGQTTATATGLCAGSYTVDVTDANGCLISATVTINEPADIVLTTATQPASCNGVCDGLASVAATGGTSGYTYLWTPGNQTADTATALCAGVYTVTVTDAHGCVKTAVVNIAEPAAITIAFAANDVTCFGVCNGDLTGTPSGGTAPYTYQWVNTPGLETTPTADSLCPGMYTLTVTDANGCSGTDSAAITEPTQLVVTTTVNNNVTCGGLCDASATAAASGGTPGYGYLWSPSGQTTATATALCAGQHVIAVTDNNGCVSTDTITITEPPVLTLIPTTTNASCGGVCDGTATANVGGGSPPYQYLWSDGQTTQTAVNLCAGTYSVTVTDGNNCTVSVTVIILEPPLLTSSIDNFTEILCFGVCDAQATVTVNGGVPPYSYLWTPGNQTGVTATNLCVGTYNVVVTDAIGCNTTATVTIDDQNVLATAIQSSIDVSCFGECDGSATALAVGGVAPYSYSWNTIPAQATATASNLCPGTYTVTVTDAANCVSTSTVTITEPALLTVAATKTDASCGGTCDGTATAAPQGGTAPYTYVWVPGGQTTATATALCAGTYTVTVTDANNCTAQATVTVNEPPVLLASASVTAPTCTNTANGAIDLTVTGGVPGYSYSWSPGGANTEDLNNIFPGVHTVTVTDNTGCQVTLAVTVIEQVVIDANAGPDQFICIGETAQLDASSSTGSGFLWTPASGLNYNNIDNPVATITTTETYIVQVTSFNCVDYDTVTITVNPLPVIDAGAGASILSGNTVQLNATGAGTNGTYSWSPTTGLDNPNIADPIASPEETTIYYVTGTDANGCSATDSLTIDVSPGIVFPDGITPNGDGKNDTWIIDFINNFPEAVVMVYNRWGEELFYSKGYGTAWDGKYKGKDLPVGTYYYVIDLHNGTEPYTGPITIAR